MYIFLLQIQHFRLNKELYGEKKKKRKRNSLKNKYLRLLAIILQKNKKKSKIRLD